MFHCNNYTKLHFESKFLMRAITHAERVQKVYFNHDFAIPLWFSVSI